MVTTRRRGARWLGAAAFGVAVVALAACNGITGADAIEIDPEVHGSTGSSTGWGGSSGVSTSIGAGEVATTTDAVGATVASSVASTAVAAGSTSASTSASTSVAASSSSSSSSSIASSSAASTGSGGPVAWPAGPYGVTSGKTLPEQLVFSGYPEGSSQAGTIALKDWYDPDGSKGIHAILVVLSQFGCGPCYQESKGFEAEIAGWKSQGLNIKVLQLVINDSGGGSADLGAASEWKQKFSLVNVAVGADPDWDFAASSSLGTPQNTIINPRTMKVVSVTEGYSGNYSKLESLAMSNK